MDKSVPHNAMLSGLKLESFYLCIKQDVLSFHRRTVKYSDPLFTLSYIYIYIYL